MTLGEDVEVVVTDEDAIGGSLSVELAGKGVGILDEQELAVGIGNLDGEGGEGEDMEEDEDN